jgi:hypothetical protein
MLLSRKARSALLGACLAVMIPTIALAQEGTIAGTIRDVQGAVLPGVTVEVTSPALIGGRNTVSDDLGQYPHPRTCRSGLTPSSSACPGFRSSSATTSC